VQESERIDSLNILSRQRRTLELRCKGLTIPQIATMLKDEGWSVSQHTLWKDLHSKTAQNYTEELLRKQHSDITNYPDIKTRLKYRNKLSKILKQYANLPRKTLMPSMSKIEVNYNQSNVN
jgi:DNA-binding transcriptional MerR regulator